MRYPIRPTKARLPHSRGLTAIVGFPRSRLLESLLLLRSTEECDVKWIYRREGGRTAQTSKTIAPVWRSNVPECHREHPRTKVKVKASFALRQELTTSQDDGHWSKSTALPNLGPHPPSLQQSPPLPRPCVLLSPPKQREPSPLAFSTKPFKPCQPVSSAGPPSSDPSQSTN